MDIHLIPPNKLDPLLTNFRLTVRKKGWTWFRAKHLALHH
jgi:hypothetical protein